MFSSLATLSLAKYLTLGGKLYLNIYYGLLFDKRIHDYTIGKLSLRLLKSHREYKEFKLIVIAYR